MSIRDLFVAAVVIGSLPLCYRKTLIGLLMFSLLAYMRLQDLAWGFARFERWSYYVALVTFAGYLADREKKGIVIEVRTVLMMLLAAMLGIGLAQGKGPGKLDWAPYFEFCKIIGVALFTTSVVRTRSHLRVLVWLITLSFAFYGVKSGIHGVVSLGRLKIIEGPGGMLKDNNDFALAMVMAIPLLLHLALSEKREALRRPLFAFIPLTMITIMATHSRGAAVSLAATLMLLVWRSKNRLAGFLIGACVVVAGVAFAPKTYLERLETIREYEEDGSAMGRIAAWKVAGRMVQESPIFGVGLDRFQQNYLLYEPNPTPQQIAGVGGTRVAHNSYFQIWAEGGTPALLIYLTLIALTFLDLWSVRRQAKRRYHRSWILSYCAMFEASLAAFVVGSTFLNRAHFDLIYHYFAIVLIFGRIARQEMASLATQPTRRQGRRGGGALVAVERRGFARSTRPERTFRTTPLVPR